MSLFSRNAESVINEERRLMERSIAKMIGEIDKFKKIFWNKVGALRFILSSEQVSFTVTVVTRNACERACFICQFESFP